MTQQLRQLGVQAQQHLDLLGLTCNIETFCQRLQSMLDWLGFSQRRQLVELLIDHAIVNAGEVEIRYVIRTSPKGKLLLKEEFRGE